jgi:protein-disulfide isomerase
MKRMLIFIWVLLTMKTIIADSKCLNDAGKIHIGYCCKTSLDSCIKMNKSCEIARRLNLFSKWLDTVNGAKPCSLVVNEIQKRYQTLTDTVTCKIDLRNVPMAGSTNSKINLVMYVSATCPLCKKVYKDLYQSVTNGELKNKARLGIKVISASAPNLALLTAAHFGKQSQLMLSLHDIKERISMEHIIKKCAEIGIPADSLNAYMNSASIRTLAEVSVSEASVNGVKYTPAFFINGKPYHSYKDPQWVIDAVLFEYDKLVGR